MSEPVPLSAVPRERLGKGASRAVRRTGFVPAVVYGEKKSPETVSVELKILEKMLSYGTFLTQLIDLDVSGSTTRVVPKDVHFHPVTDRPTHVDFLRVGPETVLQIGVPVEFVNDGASPGLKRGGVLSVVRHTVDVVCKASQIPEHITVDLTGSEVGESIHISAVTLPAGVRPAITDRDFTIATISAPSALRGAAEEEEGEGEG